MKNKAIFLLAVFLVSYSAFAQLSGVKTIPGSYSSIAGAIAALNSQGVGPGGVIFNVAAGYTETFNAATAGLITTSTSSSSRPIVFQKSGTGANPVISSSTGGAGMTDYIFCISGTDYITFERIDTYEPAGLTEWGYAILKASAADGSQYVTIKNCTITLEKSNQLTIGIYSANVTPANPQTQLTVTGIEGSNSNNKYFGNTIINCYNGIKIAGYRDPAYPYTFYDQKCEIGVEGANTITDFGGDVPACYGIYTYYQSGQKIANNVVNGYVGGSGVCAGIKIDTVNNANVDIFNNTVSIYYYGTGTFYGIYDVHGNNSTDATVLNIYNNTVANCVYDSPDYGNCTYIHVQAGAMINNFYNNIVTNNMYGVGGSRARGNLYAIFYSGSAGLPGTVSCHHNRVTHISRMQSEPGPGETNYMRVLGGGNQASCYANVIDSNIVSSSGACYGIFSLTDTRGTKTIYDNTVTNIQDAYGDIYGIYTGNSYGANLYRNKIQNLTTHGASATVTGISLNSLLVSGNMYCYNNMIGDLHNDNATNLKAIIGIFADPYNVLFLGLYNNTIYLDASSSGNNFGTCGVFMGTYAKKYELINNIIVNRSKSSGTGRTVALRYSTDQFFNYSAVSDRNLFFAGTPGPGNQVMYDGLNGYPTLADFQMRVYPADGQSISEMPSFVNAVTSPLDLHMDTSQPSVVESAGKVVTAIPVNTDIDNDPRYPNPGYPVNSAYPPVEPDLGADEFGGITADHVSPAIECSQFMNTSSLTERTLVAKITDLHGVPVAGSGLPRLAWKKFSNGAWNYVTATPMGNDNFSFTFGGGVALHDSVYYFILAQDNWNAPNTGTFPRIGSSGFSANPPVAGVPPARPFSYKIVEGLCGTIMVGAGETFTTLSAAINNLNNVELTCPTTFLLTDNLYENETYPVIINQIAGASEINTLTIKPAPGKTPSFYTEYQGVEPNYWSMITLNGAQHVIIDGSNDSGNNRSLTIRNNNNFGFTATVGFYHNGQTPASYITVKNCVIQANAESIMNNQAITTQSIIGGAGFHDIVIHNNELNTARFGAQIYGSPAHPAYNCQITNNVIGSLDFFRNIREHGVRLEYCDSILVEGNEILGSIEGRVPYGSYIGVYLGREAFNSKVRKNIIHDIFCDGEPGAIGIFYFNQSVSGQTEITDNVIYNIKAPGTSQDVGTGNAYGIYLGRGSNVSLYHNTVFLSGNYMSAVVPGMSSCIGIYSQVSNVGIKNNILKNSSMANGANPGSRAYAMAIGTGNTNITMDYNDYFVNGLSPFIGYYGLNDLLTIADWRNGTGQDLNTANVDPVFTSSAYLKPTTILMNHAGIYLPAFNTDITGLNRTNPPDVGAYEYTVSPQAQTLPATSVAATSAVLGGTILAAYFTVSSYFDYGLTSGYGNTVAGTPSSVSGNSTTNVTAIVSGLNPLTTYHYRIRGTVFGGLTVYGSDQTFTTGEGIPENTSATGTVAGDTCFNATQVITVGGVSNPFTVSATGNVTMIAGQKILMLPGTSVLAGGYMHGYISTNGQYCNAPSLPVSVNSANSSEGPFNGNETSSGWAKIYPNPASDIFYIDISEKESTEVVQMEMFNMNGVKIARRGLPVNQRSPVSARDLKSGVYFIRITKGSGIETFRLIKL